MRITQVAAVAVVAFASGGVGALSVFTLGGAHARPSGPVTLVAGNYDGTKPSAIQFSADAGDLVTGIKWSAWGSKSATGTGTVGYDNCTPNCAEGTTSYLPATITLSRPDAQGQWTVITEAEHGRTTTFSLTGHWAQGALP